MKKILYVMFAALLLVGAVFTFASCSEDPSYYFYEVSYNPVTKQLSWSDNSPADQWLVSINDGDSEKVSSTTYSYDAHDQSFEFRIEALYKDKGHEDNPVIRQTMQYIPTVTNLRVENGYLVWDAVSGATGYTVTNNGSSYSNGSECSYKIPEGSFNITVKPQGSGYYYTYESEKKSGVILASPTGLTYNNGEFAWSAVPGADFYKVTINGTDYETTETRYAFAGNQQDIEISVAAGSRQAGAYLSAPLSNTCYYLQPLTKDSYTFNQSGELVWTAVENATSYRITINDVDSQTVSETKYAGFQVDTRYNIKITPQREFSYTGEAVVYSFEKLSPVTGVKFSDGKITWNAHPRAASYEVLINGEKFDTTTTTVDKSGIESTITIEVYAKGQGENSRSYTATKETYTYLPRVQNTTIENGALVWDASEGAISYDICFISMNNQVVPTSTNSYAASNIVPNQQYIVKVIPRGGDHTYSYWSGEFTFKVLPAPTLTYDNGGFRWNGSSDVAGYKVRLGKIDPNNAENTEYTYEDLNANQLVYNNSFEQAGKYEISVKAVADKSMANVYDSAYSAVKFVTRLGDVTGHKLINTTAITDTVQVSLSSVNGATGYKVKVNGTERAAAADGIVRIDLESLANIDEETTFNLEAYATGTVTPDSVVLDSLHPYQFKLTRLATPKNVTIQGTTVKWDDVLHAGQYVVTIDGQPVEASSSQYQMTNIAAGDHKVKVQATCRDSQEYIPSKYSVEISFKKLATPGNVRVETQGEALYVKWDAPTGATAYSVKVGSNTYDAAMNMHRISDYVNNMPAGSSIQLSVYAKGNGSTVIDSEPSNTITVVKFNAPTGLAVQGDNIVWNAATVDAVSAANYDLYIDGEIIPVTGTQYATSNIAVGTHIVSVVAKGNNTTTIDSPRSATIQVTKLGKVQNVTMVAGSKNITWDPVVGATSYTVNVDGKDYYVTNPSFTVNFTEAGSKTIKIQATSGDPTVIAGDVVEKRIDVRAYNRPNFVKDISNLSAGNFTASISGNVLTIEAGAVQGLPVTYAFTVSGVTKEQTGTVYTYTLPYTDPGMEYWVQMQIIVDCFGTEDGVYYINSNPSQEQTLFVPASAN